MRNRTRVDAGEVERLLGLGRERLRELGMTLEVQAASVDADSGVDAVVALSRGKEAATYSVQVQPSMTLTSLADARTAGPRPVLVIGNRIAPRSAEAFREANFQFVDAAGNAFITFGNVFVDVRGRSAPVGQEKAATGRGGAKRAVNLFSRGRAQVIFALLAWPELATGGRRAIATAAGTSLGQAHDALTQLEAAGFLLPGAQGLIRSGELLDLWGAAYPAGLGSRLEIARFAGDPGRPFKNEQTAFLSGETAAGVDIARPASLTVYVKALNSTLAIANRWSASPDRVPNIFVRHKFWTAPHPGEEGPRTGRRNAPWPLVYADLLATGDARLAQVARTWREDHARFEQG